jgi:hypothetical protein
MHRPLTYLKTRHVDIRAVLLVMIAVCVTLFAVWRLSVEAHQTLLRLLERAWNADPMYVFERQLSAVESQIPRFGITCYVGIAPEGLSPRWAYVWTLYGLAPRVVVPWGNKVQETGTRLADVAPTLLFRCQDFSPKMCDQILVHDLGGDADWRISPSHRLAQILTSENMRLRLYVR